MNKHEMKNRVDGVGAGEIFLILFGGPAVLLPLAPLRSWSWCWRLLLPALVPYAAALLWRGSWYTFSLAFFLFNLVYFFLCLRFSLGGRIYRVSHETVDWSERLKFGGGLLLVLLPVGLVAGGVERWLSDYLWSTYTEVNATVTSILSEYIGTFSLFGLFSLCLAYSLGKIRPWSLERKLAVALGSALLALLIKEVYQLLIQVPLRQLVIAEIFPPWVGMVRNHGFAYLALFAMTYLVFQATWHKFQGLPWMSKAFRSALAIVLACAGYALMSGMPPYYGMIAGREYEKYGYTHKAVSWYARTFNWVQSEELKSYLQYRMGLLSRKNGNLTGAREAFTKVLLKYNNIPKFVQNSKKFHRILAANGSETRRRNVIPGVEARTEYKAAYCVPNSLGLVLNYWGDRVGAKAIGGSITKLNSGSFITDEAYYSETRNYNHFVLPLRNRQDIITLIDHQIPVLAFIPGHVLAIFGYDEALETFITYDVATYEIWDERSWREFGESWNKTFNLLGVVVPDARLPTVRKLFGEDLKANNEAYLQYLIYLLSNESLPGKVEHLQRARNSKLFFADWEYALATRHPGTATASRTAVHDYLLKNSAEENAVLSYLYSCALRENPGEIIAFLDRYRRKQSLSKEMTTLLAGAHLQEGSPDLATRLLISHEQFPDYDAYLLEFLLRSSLTRSNPQLALQLSIQLLSQSPHALNRGNSAKLAYAVWRVHQPFTDQNAMETLQFIHNYLKSWDPADENAIRDFETFYHKVNFSEEDEWEKELWRERLETHKSHVFVSLNDAPVAP